MQLHEHAIAEDNIREHGISLYDAVMQHKKICWWTFFFAMSAVGWYEVLLSHGSSLTASPGVSTPKSTVLCSPFHSSEPILGKVFLANNPITTD